MAGGPDAIPCPGKNPRISRLYDQRHVSSSGDQCGPGVAQAMIQYGLLSGKYGIEVNSGTLVQSMFRPGFWPRRWPRPGRERGRGERGSRIWALVGG